MVAQACNLSTGKRLRQEECCETEASLGYRMVFKTAWAMQ